MNTEAANALLYDYRNAVANTCSAKAIFNANLSAPRDEYQAYWQRLDGFLKAEGVAFVACQSAMLDCDCREREISAAESKCAAQQERMLDYLEEGK